MRKVALLTTLAAVALAAVAPTPATAVQVVTLRTLTYNIHHGAGTDGVLNLERIAKVIEASGAQVVGLQEVDKHFDARSNWVDQPAWFAARLGMHAVFAANLDWDPPAPDKPRRQYGTLILSKFPIVSSRNTLLPLYPGQEQRGLQESLIDLDGQPFRFANTHLTNDNNAERLEQARRVVEVLGTATEPTLLVGDLNAVPTAPEIKTLTAKWADTWPKVGFGLGLTSPVPLPTRRIDYQLHGVQLKPTAASVPAKLGSDHYPVAATFTVTF